MVTSHSTNGTQIATTLTTSQTSTVSSQQVPRETTVPHDNQRNRKPNTNSKQYNNKAQTGTSLITTCTICYKQTPSRYQSNNKLSLNGYQYNIKPSPEITSLTTSPSPTGSQPNYSPIHHNQSVDSSRVHRLQLVHN